MPKRVRDVRAEFLRAVPGLAGRVQGVVWGTAVLFGLTSAAVGLSGCAGSGGPNGSADRNSAQRLDHTPIAPSQPTTPPTATAGVEPNLGMLGEVEQEWDDEPAKPKAEPAKPNAEKKNEKTDDPPALPTDPKERVADTLSRGVTLLLAMQEAADVDGKPLPDGPRTQWAYEGVYRVAGNIPVGYRIGGTALCVEALTEAPGYAEHADAKAAVARALAFICGARTHATMSEENYDAGYDVRGWGYLCATHTLAKLQHAGLIPEDQKPACDAALRWYLDALLKIEMPETGGWNYARPQGRATVGAPSTFMTAMAVQALTQAREAGLTVDQAVIDRSLNFLEKSRLPSGAVLYSGAYTGGRVSKGDGVGGAVGRMCITEATLLMSGRGSQKDVRGAVEAFIVNWKYLNDRRQKTGTHVPPYMVAPYYFMFAHRYAAQAVELLPRVERDEYRARVDDLLFSVREKDGSWNDRVFARSGAYGTAMAMLAVRERSNTTK